MSSARIIARGGTVKLPIVTLLRRTRRVVRGRWPQFVNPDGPLAAEIIEDLYGTLDRVKSLFIERGEQSPIARLINETLAKTRGDPTA